MSLEHIGQQENKEEPEETSFSPDRVLLGRAIEKKRQAVLEVEELIAAREKRLSECLQHEPTDPHEVKKLKEGIRVLERTKKIRESERLILLKELYGDEKPLTIQ